MHKSPTLDPPPDPWNSTLFALAVLYSAKASGDHVLEGEARKRLDQLGVRIVFTPPDASFVGKGVTDAR